MVTSPPRRASRAAEAARPKAGLSAAPAAPPSAAGGKRSAGRDTVTREQWLAAARRALISQGVAAVKIDRLAQMLNVTRGGFYWRFSGHAALLDALLEDWRQTNAANVLGQLRGPGAPVERLTALARTWIDERGFDPRYDTAMRDWGRTSRKVARALQAFDAECMHEVQNILVQVGVPETEAMVRSRILIYHQAGYYALRVRETRAERLTLLSVYMKILIGVDSI